MKNIIKIESLAYGGYGVGRTASGVVFVDYAVPGDELTVNIYEKRKHYSFGNIVELIKPSENRVQPRCKHFGICGGCSYLNIPYEKELNWKLEIFRKEYAKVMGNNATRKDIQPETGCISPDEIEFFKNGTPLERSNFLNYRQKVEIKLSPPYAGFFRKKSHDIVNVDYCFLASDDINRIIKNLRSAIFNDCSWNVLKKISSIVVSEAGGIKNALIKLNGEVDDKARLFSDKPGITKMFDNIFAEKRLKNGKKNTVRLYGRGTTDYFKIKNLKFDYSLPTFIQVNEKKNAELIGIIEGFLKTETEKQGGPFGSVLDLFCGFGNITVFMSPYAKQITAVDSEDFSIKLAGKNLALNQIENIDFIEENAGDFLKKETGKGKRYDLVTLDPPRAGIKGLVPYICGLKPKHVIYVSCDPATLLRDIKAFHETGYKIKKIILLDMFPGTYHTESISFLEREKI